MVRSWGVRIFRLNMVFSKDHFCSKLETNWIVKKTNCQRKSLWQVKLLTGRWKHLLGNKHYSSPVRAPERPVMGDRKRKGISVLSDNRTPIPPWSTMPHNLPGHQSFQPFTEELTGENILWSVFKNVARPCMDQPATFWSSAGCAIRCTSDWSTVASDI